MWIWTNARLEQIRDRRQDATGRDRATTSASGIRPTVYEVTKLLLEGISTSHQNHLVAVQSFVEALGQYHSQCQQYVAELQSELQMSTAPSVRHTASPVNGSTASAPVEKKRARVLQDYDASDRSELSLIEGEVVNVYHDDTLNDGWIMAERGGQKGKVPLIYLELQ